MKKILFIFLIFSIFANKNVHSEEFFGIDIPGFIKNYKNYKLIESNKNTYHEVNSFDVIPPNPSSEFNEYQVRTFKFTNDELIKNYKPKNKNDFILSLWAQGKIRYDSFEECERNNQILFKNLSEKYNTEGFNTRFTTNWIDKNTKVTFPMYLIKNDEVTHRIYGWCGSNNNIRDFKAYKYPKLNLYLEKAKNLFQTKYHQVVLIDGSNNNMLEYALLDLIEQFKRGDYSTPKNLQGF